jgi:DNA-directed RNA polymerase specialized sigma24 family protein
MAGRGENEGVRLLAEFTYDVGEIPDPSSTVGRGVNERVAGVTEIVVDLAAPQQPAPLTPEERTLLQLCYLDGLTLAQVGERPGLPVHTITSRLRSCLDRLKASLGPETGENR